MEPENTSPTNEPIESASRESHGGNVGGALSEDDFIRYFNEKHSKSSETTEPAKAETKAETEANDDADSVDISDLEDDSTDLDTDEASSDSNDTKASDTEESKEEPVFELQVDGQTIEVKQSELIADAQKYRASESKFEAASKMRKEAEEVKGAYTKDRDTLDSLLAQYQNFMNEQMQARQPDWNALLQNDPAEYIRQKEYFLAMQQEQANAKAYQEQIREQREIETKQAAEKHTSEQRAIVFKKFPQWKNPEVLTRDQKLMQDYLDTTGFTAQEQDGLQDARMLEVVYKAAKYDQAVKAKDQKKAKPSTGKTLTSGASQAADPGFNKRQEQTAGARHQKALNDAFKQNGDFDSFRAMFTNQMRNKR
ncbi:hypothetical protein BG58_10985 [Caballeronia jiangsuensis]|nr:hypothetical protein BG58_10985 [Caballeronia jiangsuensis]